jgi:hypothetical protein
MFGRLEIISHFGYRPQGFGIAGEQLTQMGQANKVFV